MASPSDARSAKTESLPLRHFRSPCVHCGTAMEDVAPGPCPGDPAKAVPMAFRYLGIRWDGVEHYLIQYSDGHIEDRWEHIEMRLRWDYLKDARNDPTLRRPS